jgi:large subunit ribosomal protein L6
VSRIGRLPVVIAPNVEVRVEGGVVRVKGPKGTVEQRIVPRTRVEIEGDRVLVRRDGEDKRVRAAHGLMRSQLANMVTGVTRGFEKTLEIVGVGYRAEVRGRELRLQIGFTLPVVLPIPGGLEVALESPTRLVVRGADKQKVGQFAAEIRRVREPEPYKGKGIRYADEQVRRKVGKAGVGGTTPS